MTTKKCQIEELSPTCPRAFVQIDPVTGYISNIDEIQRVEYSNLHGDFILYAFVIAAYD
jgi:hypothetical protein